MKPVVTKIEIEPEELEELETNMTDIKRKSLIKQYAGGTCLGCDNVPTKLVSYDISDADMNAQLVERYCDNCFKRSGIGEKVLLTSTNGIDKTIAVKEGEKISHLGA